MAPDGSRFVIRNDLLREDGKLCARVTSVVGWLDLVARKLVAPPEALLAAVRSADRTSDFVELPSALTGRP
jgi:acyl-CoA thioester hydrolase